MNITKWVASLIAAMSLCASIAMAQTAPAASAYLSDEEVILGSWKLRAVLSPESSPGTGVQATMVLAVAESGSTVGDNVVAIVYERDTTLAAGWQAKAWDSNNRIELASAIATDLGIRNSWEVSAMLGLIPESPPPGSNGLITLRDIYKGLYEDDPINALLTDGEHRAIALMVLTDAGYASTDLLIEVTDTYKRSLLNWLSAHSLAQFVPPGVLPSTPPLDPSDPSFLPPLPPDQTLNPDQPARRIRLVRVQYVSDTSCGAWYPVELPSVQADALGFGVIVTHEFVTPHLALPYRTCCKRECAIVRRRVEARYVATEGTNGWVGIFEYFYQVVRFFQRCCPTGAYVGTCSVLPPGCNVTPTEAVPEGPWMPSPPDRPDLPLLVPQGPSGPISYTP